MVSCFTVEVFLSVDTLFSLSLHDRKTKPADRVLLYPKVFTVDIGQKAGLVSREPAVFLHKACVYVNFYYFSHKHVVGRIFMYLPDFTFEVKGDSAIMGQDTSLQFSGVSFISLNLSASAPDLTPHQSAAKASSSVVRFITNSLSLLIIP